ncbi:hypothetical protein VNO77_43994 [Canavalia gladiata]|uniref:Uncharacterized protein n=1 Tax=Canavalia gladiata TaxID=3824 RepID=A0AAN9JV46_CANGL
MEISDLGLNVSTRLHIREVLSPSCFRVIIRDFLLVTSVPQLPVLLARIKTQMPISDVMSQSCHCARLEPSI